MLFNYEGVLMSKCKVVIAVVIFIATALCLIEVSDQTTASDSNVYVDEDGGAIYQVIDGKSPKANVTGWDGIHSDVKIKLSVTVNGQEYPVKSVKDSAFKGTEITSVTFPDSETSIDITNNSFEGCTQLKSIVLGTSVAIVGNSLFKGCTALESFSSSAITSIGTNAFSGCVKLTDVKLNSGLKTISESAFLDCSSLNTITLPDSVSTLGPSVFKGCTVLKTVTLPSTLSIIPAQLFNGCSSLESISIPGTVKSFGTKAFFNCSSLKSVEFKEGIESIEASYLFAGCAFTQVTLPSTVKSLYVGDSDGKNAKHEQWPSCLSSINVNENNPYYTSVDGVLYSKDGKTLYLCPLAKTGSLETSSNIGNMACWNSALTSVTLKDGCTSIAESAFSGSSVTKVSLPNTLVKLGSYAFSNCKDLVEISLSESITKIPDGAFSKCTKLSISSIPAGIVSVGNYAFLNCANVVLSELPDTLAEVGQYAFNGTGIEKIEIGKINSVSVDIYAFGGNSLKSVTLGKVTPDDGVNETSYRYLFYGPNLEKIETSSEFKLWVQKGSLSIGPNGELYSCLPTASGKIIIPSEVTSILGAFRDCKNVTEIEYEKSSNTVTVNSGSTYHGSFEGCVALTSVTLPNVNIDKYEGPTFKGCTQLSKISIVTIDRIPDYAFDGTALNSLTLDYSRTEYVGIRAFSGLHITSFDASGMEIAYEAFKDCSELTDFVTDSKTVLGTGALANTAIKKLKICLDSAVLFEISYGTSTVRGIASRLCYGCTQLSEVEFVKGSSAEMNLGESSFEGCTALKTITVPESIMKIYFEKNALKSSGLTSLAINCSSILFNQSCFEDCKNLASVNLQSDYQMVIYPSVFKGCSSLKTVSISNLSALNLSAFYGCSSLEILKLGTGTLSCLSTDAYDFDPDALSVKTIDIGKYSGSSDGLIDLLNYSSVENFICTETNGTYSVVDGAVYALSGGVPVTLMMCSKTVTELTIPETVKTIGEHAFDGCVLLKKVKFPSSLETYSYSGTEPPEFYLTDGSGLSSVDLSSIKGSTFSIRDVTGKLFLNSVISFDTDGGSSIDAITQDYNTEVTVSAVPVKEGYIFLGWDKTVPKMMPTENVTLKALWGTGTQYSVYFDTDGGSSVNTLVLSAGETISEPEAPTRAESSFQYWTLNGEKYVFGVMPAENIVLKAKWKLNQYSIIFDTDGGSEVAKITADYGTPVNAPEVPTKAGYVFQYWALDGKNYSFTTIPSGDITLKAVWAVKQYTISFDTDGGSEIASISLVSGTPVTAPENPIKVGYTFQCWTLNGEKYVFGVMPAEDILLKAVWVSDYSTISFDTDGGSEVAGITEIRGASVSAPGAPTKIGYTFLYWTLDGKEYTFTVMPAENIALKAMWKINQYTITFDTDGGSAISAIKGDYGFVVTAPANPVKDGYTFVKWDSAIPAKIPAGDLTIKAVWAKNYAADPESGNVTVDAADSGRFVLSADVRTVIVNVAENMSVKVENAENLAGLTVISEIKEINNTSDKVGTAYEFTFTADSVPYNGKMIVTLPYTDENGKHPAVYYWDGTGSQKMDVVSFTSTSVTFETEHNSEYVVVSESVSEKSDSGLMIAGIMVLLIVVLAVVVLVIKRREAA